MQTNLHGERPVVLVREKSAIVSTFSTVNNSRPVVFLQNAIALCEAVNSLITSVR